MMTGNAFIIGFRDRATDEYRKRNFDHVLAYVESINLGPVYVVDDGNTGTAQWNRHKAYNTGAALAFGNGATTATFYEADMIVPRQQLVDGITAALDYPHLVIPFNERHEYNAQQSEAIMDGIDPGTFKAPVVKRAPRRIGAVNIISQATYEAVGRWDEQHTGSWFDDRAMGLAFKVCTGRPEQWIPGPSVHLWHKPGYEGTHLTPEDKAATAANRARFRLYQQAHTKDQMLQLTTGTR